MNALAFVIIIGLSCWSLTSLLVYEEGPYNILGRFRGLVGVVEKFTATADQLNIFLEKNPEVLPSEIPDRWGRHELGKLFACPWCLSVWVAAAMVTWIVYLGVFQIWMWPFAVLGSRCVSMIIEMTVRR